MKRPLLLQSQPYHSALNHENRRYRPDCDPLPARQHDPDYEDVPGSGKLWGILFISSRRMRMRQGEIWKESRLMTGARVGMRFRIIMVCKPSLPRLMQPRRNFLLPGCPAGQISAAMITRSGR